MNRRRAGSILLAVAGVAALLLAAAALGLTQSETLSTGLAEARASVPGMLLLLLAIFCCGFLALPVAPLQGLGGALWGWSWHPAGVVAVMLGGLVGWVLGRRIPLEQWLNRLPGKVLPRVGRWLAGHPWSASFGLRLVPGLPFGIQNGLLGAAGVGLLPFLVSSLLAVSGSTAVFVASGQASVALLPMLHEALWVGVAAQVPLLAAGLWLRFGPDPQAQKNASAD